MRRLNIFVAISVAAAVGLSIRTETRADLPVFDPMNYAKSVLIEANTLKATINQATQIAYQLQQIQLQASSLRAVPKGLWGQIRTDLAQLQRVVQRGQGIGYTDQNLSNDFRDLYPGYASATDYALAYRRWTQNTLGNLQTSLEDAGAQSEQLQSEDDVLASLALMSDGAAGHMQALQVANMIAVQQVQQLQKLRQLQMGQIQAQVGYLATQQQIQSSQYAALKAWIDSANAPAHKF